MVTIDIHPDTECILRKDHLRRVRRMVVYSYGPIMYDYNRLTLREKAIFGDPKNFAAFVRWALRIEEAP